MTRATLTRATPALLGSRAGGKCSNHHSVGALELSSSATAGVVCNICNELEGYVHSTFQYKTLAEYFQAETLLHSMFYFKHLPGPQQQSTAAVRQYCQMLEAFCKRFADAGMLHTSSSTMQQQDSIPRWSIANLDDLPALHAAVDMLKSDKIAWYPDFGCALVAVPSPELGDLRGGVSAKCEDLALHLVALDDWRSIVHSSPGSTDCTSTATNHRLLYCGSIPDAAWGTLNRTIADMLQQHQTAKKKDRGHAFNHTPGMVHAVAQDAVQNVLNPSEEVVESEYATAPTSGFTDVGRHRGAQPRDTSWLLVQQTFLYLLRTADSCSACEDTELLYRQLMVLLDLWLLLGLVKHVTPDTADSKLVDICMVMLQSVNRKAAALAADKHGVGAILAAAQAIKHRLEVAVMQRQLLAADRVMLPLDRTTSSLLGHWGPPTGVVPAEVLVSNSTAGLDAVKQRAARNLGSLPVVAPEQPLSAVLPQLQQLLQGPAAASCDDVKLQHALHSVEVELFSRAVLGISGQRECTSLTEAVIDQLWEVVDSYRECLVKFKESVAGQAPFQMDLRSREVLVVWIAYCFTFETSRQHPVVAKYGVALQYEDLRHLSLSDRAAVDAALAVGSYLKNATTARPLFSLRDKGKATFDMAEEYASNDSDMRSIWTQEQSAAGERISCHWQKVQQQQGVAHQLRSQLRQLQDQERSFAASYYHYSSNSYSLERKLTNVRREISITQTELAQAESPPKAVIQPLPEAESRAMCWIFFLYMPPLLRHLSRASFLAQQLLLPLPLTAYPAVQKQLLVGDHPTSLAEFYNTASNDSTWHSVHPQKCCLDGRVMLYSTGKPPPQHEINPCNIDSFYNDRDGVLYPDSLRPGMTWRGSGCSADNSAGLASAMPFDPFREVKELTVLQSFTEQVSQSASSLQWAMLQPYNRLSTPAERGNMGVAQQDQTCKPQWLSKQAYLKLMALRSYGLRQLHRLCDLLNTCQDLPYDRPAVQAMLRQTLYHLGPLVEGSICSSSGSTQLMQQWRTDWDVAGGVLETLSLELQRCANELFEKPRAHASVLLLGEIAAYLSDWHASCKAVARKFAAMTSKQANSQLQGEVATAANEVAHAEALAKQCKSRMLALLCYAAGPLEAQDVGHMVNLMVHIKHGDVYLGQMPVLQQELSELRVLCHKTMCRRVRDMQSRLQDDHMTAAMTSVLQSVPSSLPWKPVLVGSSTSASYEAVASDNKGHQHLYSINILDGTVLLDGFPPGRLPRDITCHSSYIRSFGSVDFEVSETDQGVLATVRSVNGRWYEFYVSAGSCAGQPEELVITEVDKQTGQRLQLLHAGEGDDCKPWGDQLPVRLRGLYSHWLSRQHGVILLRPLAFEKHDVYYIMKYTASGGDTNCAANYDCWRVPHHLQGQHWCELIDKHIATLQENLLVRPEPSQRSHVLQVLSKFEQEQFIHAYTCPVSSNSRQQILMAFELPRFGLEFELHHSGQLVSKDFRGYRLHECQQLAQETADKLVRYTLPDFDQYLVLQRCDKLGSGHVPGSGRADVLVLVPCGQVQPGWATGRKVKVLTDGAAGARLQYHTYEVHGRFGYLKASTILSRLQLGALYAATSSLIAEPSSQQTGAETAMQLMRRSWVNQPLSAAESQQLQSIATLGGHLAPALRLLVYNLESSTCQLQHLHENAGGAAAAQKESASVAGPEAIGGSSCTRVELDVDAAADYQQMVTETLPGSWGLSIRQVLTPLEEKRILHCHNKSAHTVPQWLRNHGTRILEVPACSVSDKFVSKIEQQLSSLVVQPQAGAAAPPYPLTFGTGDPVPLSYKMHSELQASWEAYHRCPEPSEIVPDAKQQVAQMQVEARRQRQLAQDYLLQNLSALPDQDSQAGICFSLLQTAGLSPSVALEDLLSCAVRPELMQRFNPFISEAAHESLRQGIITWAQLCVLEDKLSRVMNLFAADLATYLPVAIRELRADCRSSQPVQRIWDPAQHPKWLVFEVEGQLQIRPDQYHLARELLSHSHNKSEPGPVTQMNMGEGKTRVILPMLAMEWADRSCVVRLNFLSTLLATSQQHLHNTLTDSVLNMKLFTMPFHRNVKLTTKRAHAMLGALTYCQQVGGLLLVAPEHRLSLLLKSVELWSNGEYRVHEQLQQLMAVQYQDILDESDELLHHRLQLIYACGLSQSLPALQQRTSAIQQVLRLISNMVDAGTCPELGQAGVAAWTPSSHRQPGSFCSLQLLPGAPLESVIKSLHKRLAHTLVAQRSYEMRWLDHLGEAKDQFFSCIVDPATAAKDLTEDLQSQLFKVTQGQHDHVDQVLALRGLMACNLLQHTLQKRHRVDYGISRLQTARKRLAVPFRAADTPAERSEFAQPDVALLLTHLSYYADGLSMAEFKEALGQLLLMGPSAQEDHYKQWLKLSAARIAPEHKPVFDAVRKVDPSNHQQMKLMHTYMSHNMEVVNFWLCYCVLPKETVMYPKRLVSTSWNLADNVDGRVVGFSGTNDNHRLLPTQVKQKLMLDHPHLLGTNGKMLSMLLTRGAYKTLQSPSSIQQGAPKPMGQLANWQKLLDYALHTNNAGRHGVEALLDCGALLAAAGIETRDAAEYVLQHMPQARYKGVCYFEAITREWTVRDPEGRVTPLHRSPTAASDCFVIYDDARCRGADLKLKQQAVGLLTLAPGICKDKMMQAAGRLRQLGRGQTIVVTGTPDVTDKICTAAAAASGLFKSSNSEPSMAHVLQWVMDNTVQETLHGVVEHATQGMLFAVAKGAPARAMLDEKLLLREFYGSSKAPQPVSRILQATAAKAKLQLQQSGNSSTHSTDGATADVSINTLSRTAQRLGMTDADRLQIIQKMLTGSARGEGHLVVAGQGADEECERELEQEEEEEKEQEIQIPRVTPAAEVDWQYETAFAASSVRDVIRRCDAGSSGNHGFCVLPLPEVARLLGPNVAAFAWSDNVYCTSNFVHAIQQPASASADGLNCLAPYQRYVDSMLVLASGEVLLLSERQAEALQEVAWGFAGAVAQSCPKPPLLLNLCYARQAMAAAAAPLLLGVQLRASAEPGSASGRGRLAADSPQQLAAEVRKRLCTKELISIQLFNGAACYDSKQQRQVLHELAKGRRAEVKELLEMRNQLTMFARSDLERACDVMV